MAVIIADEAIPFLQGILDPYASVTRMPSYAFSRDTIRRANALLIRTRTRCDESLLDGTEVRFIATATIGLDHIDLDYCRDKGIVVTSAPGSNASSVEQYLLASLLTLHIEKKINFPGKTIGIIGAGHVGTRAIRTGNLLGMKVLINDPPRERKEGTAGFVSIESLVETSDIISIHVPLTHTGPDPTHHLFDNALMNRVRPGTWLVNTARGEVVSTHALMSVLASQKLSGAILDVWENEPHAESDLVQSAFIATPHVAGYSLDGKANATAMVVRNTSLCFGFPLTDWKPPDSALFRPPPVAIDGHGKSSHEILAEALNATYDIRDDHRRFTASPGSFEKLRNHYPPRREPGAYTIVLKNTGGETKDLLSEAGFRISC